MFPHVFGQYGTSCCHDTAHLAPQESTGPVIALREKQEADLTGSSVLRRCANHGVSLEDLPTRRLLQQPSCCDSNRVCKRERDRCAFSVIDHIGGTREPFSISAVNMRTDLDEIDRFLTGLSINFFWDGYMRRAFIGEAQSGRKASLLPSRSRAFRHLPASESRKSPKRRLARSVIGIAGRRGQGESGDEGRNHKGEV